MPRLPALPLLVLLPFAAGCGDDGLRVRGTFADAGAAPLRVWAAEAEREAKVEDGAFSFDDLAPGPVTLVVRGEGGDVGRIELRDLVSAGSVEMEGLRIDRPSGRAFPASVRLRGAERVSINGVRYASAALPAEVAEDGVVLAVSHPDGAMLFRPAGAELPDLRVLFGEYAEDMAQAVRTIVAGDSVRVEGTTQDGYVLASRIVRPGADSISTDTPLADGDTDGASDESSAFPASTTPPPQVREAPPGRRDRPGRGNGRGHAKKPKGH